MDGTGTTLYRIVDAYERLGWHRTGTDVDHRTASWFAGELERRGLAVHDEEVAFARWATESSVRVDGVHVEHLPLQTPWVGEIRTTAPDVVLLDPRRGGFPEVVDAPLRDAAARGARAVILATDHPNGSLVGINRHPGDPDTPSVPAVLVAGRDLARCRDGSVELHLHARHEQARTSNVVGRRAGQGPSVVLTTPLNGWFGCAGERGTGIAVLLALVDHLRDVDLTVVATGGHELGFFGAHHHLERIAAAPDVVVHLGASIAVEEHTAEGRRLASTRNAMTTLDAHTGAGLVGPLERARVPVRFAADQWIGEGKVWRTLDTHLLSISGAGVDFHTPEDTTDRVTSPEALAIAAGAVVDAVDALLAAT